MGKGVEGGSNRKRVRNKKIEERWVRRVGVGRAEVRLGVTNQAAAII